MTFWRMLSTLFCAVICCNSIVSAAPSLLSKEFAAPPMKARPWVFWWFEGGYGNKEGMAKDIAAMREKGIGGVMHMQTIDTTGLPLPSQPPMLGAEWADWFGEAAKLAGNADMTFAASMVDGWAFGGKWVDKEHAAMMLVSSELQVDRSTDMSQPLPKPFNRLDVYHDVAVIAFPERATRALTPASAVGSNTHMGYCAEENWPAIHAADCDPDTFWKTSSAPSVTSPVWIQYAYSQPLTAVSVYLKGMPGGGPRESELQVSDDGQNFRSIKQINMKQGEAKQISIAETTGRYFRLVITSAYSPDVSLAEFQMLRQGDQPTVRQGIKWWNYKSGNRGILVEAAMDDNNPFHKQYDLKSSQVIDLTKYLRPDGHLDWKAPSGRWTIMRFGWTTIGQPARMSAGGGYEVDVLSTKGADLMFDNAAMGMLKATEKSAPGVMKLFHTDSWEIGADVQGQQPTWTPEFREQFRKRRGYDLLSMLPAMARRIVDDSETTERFLTDYRATIADLVADYYGQLQHRAHLTNTMMNPESGYGSYPSPHQDGLKVFGRADLPMAEVSHNNSLENVSSAMSNPFADALRTAASGARIYGRQIVQAETLTYHPWLGQVTAPDRYRKTLNYCFANGLNSAVIHKYVHQPFEYKPGLEDYGIFSRHYTWWPMAEGMLNYIGRCQCLLQQGKFVADAAYFVGEGSSRYVPSKASLKPALPLGCDYDGINAEVLLTRLSVKNGRWTLPDRLSYRYLVLTDPYSSTMSTEVLQKIANLVAAGGTLVGKPPTRTPGLANRASAEVKLKALVNTLWGTKRTPKGIHSVGIGRVVWGLSIDKLMQKDNSLPDMVATDIGNASTAKRAGLANASWIWHGSAAGYPAPGTRYFRSTIDLPAKAKVQKALVSMSADNEFTLTVNGKECLKSVDWQKASDADISKLLKAGRNTVLVKAVNITNEPSPAGLIGKFVVTLSNGKTTELCTDADTWQSSQDAKTWTSASIVGPLGCSPWGSFDPSATISLDWIHRRTKDTDIYFVANPSSKLLKMQIALRITGKVPELFDPLTGKVSALPSYSIKAQQTVIPMRFEAYQGLFIIFRQKAATPATVKAKPNFHEYKPMQEVKGPWAVQFDPAWVSPALGTSGDLSKGRLVFKQLTDWTKRAEPGLRFYSGIATYSTSFNLPQGLTPAQISKLRLSLGVVKDIARVRLNGKDLGVTWCEPWQADLGAAIKPGVNTLEIEVANLWANRVIGDAALPVAQRLTKSNFQLGADTPLYSSGLLGPVQILAVK